jgi:hypothetical protein
MSSQTLEDMISALLVEEKRTITWETKGDSQPEMTLYLRNNRSRSAKDNGEMECYYCKKMGHTAWNCRFRANDILKGKAKDKPHVANVAIIEDPPDVNNGDDPIEERAFYAF